MKVIAVSQARTGSTRLPNKILKQVNGKTLLSLHIERILRSKKIDQLIIATTVNKSDDAVIELCDTMKVRSFRGDENNVLDRFYKCLKDSNAEWIVRLTSDCPLIDTTIIDSIIDKAIEQNVDYCSNTLRPTFPDGMDVEVFKFSALEKAWKEATKNSDKEHVTPYIHQNSTFNNKKLFTSYSYENSKDLSHVRLTVDEAKDLLVINALVEELGDDKGWETYANYYLQNKKIMDLNNSIERNEGFKRSLDKDKL